MFAATQFNHEEIRAYKQSPKAIRMLSWKNSTTGYANPYQKVDSNITEGEIIQTRSSKRSIKRTRSSKKSIKQSSKGQAMRQKRKSGIVRQNSIISSKLKSSKSTDKNDNVEVLLIMNYDDTLIPTTMLNENKGKIPENQLKCYSEQLDKFIDATLQKFNSNKNQNVYIISNETAEWITKKSLSGYGESFKDAMEPINKKIHDSKIEVMSAEDNKREGKIKADDPYKLKRIAMKQIIERYYGERLTGDHDVKIISIGDYAIDFEGAESAYENYLSKQDEKVLNKINTSLVTVKLADKPTVIHLANALKWLGEQMDEILEHKNGIWEINTYWIMENVC